MKKKTLVIGASENPERYSNKAIKKLKQNNHPIVAIGLRDGEVDGVKISKEVVDTNDIDTVTMYVGPKHQASYFDIISNIKPQRIILNPGTENAEIEKLAQENDIEVVHGCTLVMLSTGQY
ncbi:CoA-binding protein [Labilibacter marinus]|uniref:CoA-binding protein n=1 Tax=Labilibacter marinus TaxID=1477105 RepID=UPI00094FA783|nr:CoA-binding protein [Labilibacter marinus]